MKIEIAELNAQDKIERNIHSVKFAIEITDFNKTPYLDRIFGQPICIHQRQDESDDEFKKRIAENTLDTNFYYNHVGDIQQRAFNKSIKQLIKGLAECGLDARKLKKQYRKGRLIKGKFN